MTISADEILFWQWGAFKLNATIVYTWIVMLLLTLGSWLITRRLSSGSNISRWQNMLEVVVGGMRDHIKQISRQNPERYLPFVGTLFLYVLVSNLLTIVPGFMPPTSSLSTTTALAICVFLAVPLS